MILVISKKLHEHAKFVELMRLMVSITGRSFERIDPDFMYTELASVILCYFQNKYSSYYNHFSGYGAYTGLFNSISKENSMNKMKVKVGDEEMGGTDIINFLKENIDHKFKISSLIQELVRRSTTNILLVEGNDTWDTVLKGVDTNRIMYLDSITDRYPVYDEAYLLKQEKKSYEINMDDPLIKEKLFLYYAFILEGAEEVEKTLTMEDIEKAIVELAAERERPGPNIQHV